MDIPSREPSDDIVEWVSHVVANTIYVDHRLVSPTCAADKISEVRIPTQPGNPIGVGAEVEDAPLPN